MNSHPIGEGPCYIIAEAGSNHDRDLDQAKRLIDVAAEAGADAVKFQTYSGKRLYATEQAAELEALELPREWQAKLQEYAEGQDIDFLSTPFDIEAIAELDALNVPMLKIASFENVDLDLIRAAADTGRPLLISTGMASMGEIEDALDAAAGTDVALMQCTSIYPAPPVTMNLRAMETMRRAFGVPVGLSDHTLGIAVPVAAAALGASVIEKHFTLDSDLPGPDHGFALEPDELGTMVDEIREVALALGDGRKQAELGHPLYCQRRSMHFTRDIAKGSKLRPEMLRAKRPNSGIAPKDTAHVIGKELRFDVREDEPLIWQML